MSDQELPVLKPYSWIPVPDEGWEPAPATAGNPNVIMLNGQWNFAIRGQKADVSMVHDNAGQWMLSGIWRDIFLFYVPTVHVGNFNIHADYIPQEQCYLEDAKLHTGESK